MPNEYHVIYLDESSELAQKKIEELIERLKRTGKIVRLSCTPSSGLSGEKGGVSYVKDRRAPQG
jgi:hypothetical protein